MTSRRLEVPSCIAFPLNLPNPLQQLLFTPQDPKSLNSVVLVLGDVPLRVSILQTQTTH